MALDPAVLEARIHYRVCELRVLAAQTAVDWGAQASERELEKKNRNPLVRQLARRLLDASKRLPRTMTRSSASWCAQSSTPRKQLPMTREAAAVVISQD